jgi:hypothetical protein
MGETDGANLTELENNVRRTVWKEGRATGTEQERIEPVTRAQCLEANMATVWKIRTQFFCLQGYYVARRAGTVSPHST